VSKLCNARPCLRGSTYPLRALVLAQLNAVILPLMASVVCEHKGVNCAGGCVSQQRRVQRHTSVCEMHWENGESIYSAMRCGWATVNHCRGKTRAQFLRG
jgi:hypothetical protein